MGLKITPLVYSIHREKEHPIFGDDAIHVTGRDDSGGLFITVEMVFPSGVNEVDFGQGKISIDLEELDEINKIVALLKKDWDEKQ